VSTKSRANQESGQLSGLSACLVGSDRVKADAGSSLAKTVIINHFSGNRSEETATFSVIPAVWMAEV